MLLAALIWVGGCSVAAPADPRPVAKDVVCLHKGDLGCVDVRVDANAAQAVYAGKTYYFCSESCRDEFEKKPELYVN